MENASWLTAGGGASLVGGLLAGGAFLREPEPAAGFLALLLLSLSASLVFLRATARPRGTTRRASLR